MRVLFIGFNEFNKNTGGSMCSKRNFEYVSDICGKDNVKYIMLHDLQNNTFRENVFYKFSKIFRHSTKELLKIKDYRQYDVIYIDSSFSAFLIKKIKRQGYKGKFIVFFHNCEYDFRLSQSRKWPWSEYFTRKEVVYNERCALNYADCCIFLNKRDLYREIEIYGKYPQKFIVCPMTFRDRFNQTKSAVNNIASEKAIYTFLGSYFPPNVDGIKWFIKNVLPYVNIHLRVIGNGMEQLNKDVDCSNVELLGSVPDLEPYLIESDYMLYPIFIGSGMKIKTCEALMYAKNIIGTPEAFSGYDISDFSKIGACCNDANDFIDAINNISMPRYNPDSRRLFLENYSFDKGLELFRKLFEDLLPN